MSAPMNVLFITADQWRGDSLSSLGHPCLQTPNLDRLAADGMLFEQHFAQATPCGPSRASLYTGMYLQNHRSVNNGTPLDARHSNIALEARKAGYDPALFGYTDVSVDPRQHTPGDPALRTYSGVLAGMTPVVHVDDHALPWLADLKAKGYTVPEGLLGVYKPKDIGAEADDRGLTFAPAQYTAEDNYTAFLTNELIKYLSVRVDKPWFVHLSYLAPHPPFVVPEPYHAMYDPGEVPKPVRAATVEEEAAQHPYLNFYLYNQKGWGIRYDHSSKNNLQLDDRDVLQARATYYGMMSEVDFQIGRLLTFLQETDAYDNTMVVFTSDHGEQLGDHWQFSKYAYFDQSFHIPLIVRDPRAAARQARGRRVSAFTESVDIMPTILDGLRVPVPSQCDGETLAPFCRGETPAGWRTEAHWEFDFRRFIDANGDSVQGLKPDQCAVNVIRGERYKYVHFTAMPPLLFDLVDDPGEFRNLAQDPACQPTMLEFAQKMLSWRMNHDERVLANTLLTPKGVVERKMPRR
ncbi:MAG: sulfatase [Gammaproteobacteria bacterium]|nr:MAG: sulfatase [Gammaproteobacteria bacterium]